MTRRLSKQWQVRGWTCAVLLAAAFGRGCRRRPGGVGPWSRPLGRGGYTGLGKVRGQDCVYHLLGLIPVTGGNEMRNAVEDALRTKPLADALVEVTVDGYFQYFILFSRACTQVYGTAVETK